jgi:SAM-dependent methyltransferase
VAQFLVGEWVIVMDKIFNQIYSENVWNDPFSRSGTGSNLVQTQKIRIALPAIIEKYKIKSFLDIPCGDFFWMKEIQPILSKTLNSYIGGDIVEDLIEQNTRQFSNSKFKFVFFDIQNSLLPRADVVFCRDCLVHFSYEDIFKAVHNIKKSQSKYLLTTTFPRRKNRNIITGAWFPINLQNFPFYFRKPLEIIEEDCTEDDRAYIDKSIALWEIRRISITKFRIALFMFSAMRKLISITRRWKEQVLQK